MLNFFQSLVVLVFCSGFALAQDTKRQTMEVEADTLFQRQDFNAAIKIYSKLIKTSKQNDQSVYGVHYKRAVCYYSIGDFESALKDLDIFVPAYPGSFQAHLLRAFVFKELEDSEHQLLELEEAMRLRPGDIELQKWRASLYLDKGNYLLAKKDFLEVKRNQNDPELETYLGMAYYNLNQVDSALLALNHAIELDATYLPAYFYAASFCLQEEEYDLALKYISIPLRLDSKNPTALFYKGVALIEKKKLDEGCRCLNKAFYLGYDDAADYLKEYCYEVEN